MREREGFVEFVGFVGFVGFIEFSEFVEPLEFIGPKRRGLGGTTSRGAGNVLE